MGYPPRPTASAAGTSRSPTANFCEKSFARAAQIPPPAPQGAARPQPAAPREPGRQRAAAAPPQKRHSNRRSARRRPGLRRYGIVTAANGSRRRPAETRAKPACRPCAFRKPGYQGRVGSRDRQVRCHAFGNYHPGPAPATGLLPPPPVAKDRVLSEVKITLISCLTKMIRKSSERLI